MNKREITNLLRVLVKRLENMSEEEFQQFLNGTDRLAFTRTRPKKSKGKISEDSKVTADELESLIPKLRECKTRDEVRGLLHKDPRITLKGNLEHLAKLLKVHVNKHDKREAIEEKILESVIGVRLRSEAILGVNLKGSGTR
jgi:hypothetical protein